MRIVKFSAENVKKLKAVEITPQGNLVEITGPNGQGKSSVLDAIYWALKGAAADMPSAVVRQGEDSAVIKLDLGELRVTRRFRKDGNVSLVVESEKGARFPSPQRMLDELIGALSFDPLEFTRLKPRDQLAALRQVVTLDRDLDALDQETKEVFDQRTATNRIVRELETRLAATPRVPEGTPDQPIDFNRLISEIDDAGTFNTHREVELRQRQERALAMKTAYVRAKECEEENEQLLQDEVAASEKAADDAVKIIADAEEQCKQVMVLAYKRHDDFLAKHDKWLEASREKRLEQGKRISEYNARGDSLNDELCNLEPIPEPVDTVALLSQVNQAQVTNQQVELKKKRVELVAKLKAETAKMEEQTKTIEANKRLRDETIAAAQMPVEGLAFGNGEVLYNNLPLNVASSAEQLRVSVALAMAANPKLRVLRIKDGSLLDEKNLTELGSLCEASDYQLWIERVEEAHGRPCVIMEDGRVKYDT